MIEEAKSTVIDGTSAPTSRTPMFRARGLTKVYGSGT